MSGLLLGWPLRETRARPGFALDHTASTTRSPEPEAGPPIIDDSESHCAVIAPTGAGKGRNVIIPNLLHWPHSAIVVDMKGEAALATARYRRSLGQRVVVLDPFQRASDGQDGLNPLDWLATSPEMLADNATTLSEMLTGPALSLKEPFWDHLANDLVAGLIAHCATVDDPAQRSIAQVFDILSSDDPVYRIAVMLDTRKDMPPFARRQLACFLAHEAEKVRSSVRSTAQQHLRIFANPLVAACTSHTSFELGAIARGEPTTIYLVLPATRLQSHAALLRLWLSVLLGVIADRTAQPEAPTLLIVDELAQLGPMPSILQALTLLRSSGLRVMVLMQSLAQLSSLWPQDHQVVLDNCGIVAAFGQLRPPMAEPVSHLMGDLSPETLLRMPLDRMAINRVGQGTVIARKADYLTDPWFAGRADRNPMYGRRPAG